MGGRDAHRGSRRWGRKIVWVLVLLLLGLGLLGYVGGDVTTFRREGGVALIRINGPIVHGKGFVRLIEKYQEDASIKALVVQVNSPGGGVAASQEIYHALLRFKESGKWVLASMEGVAASGGYYVALASNKIFANAGTITGSIGVILQVSNVEGLLKKVGLKVEVVKSGEYKDVGSTLRPLTDKDRKVLEKVINDAYEQFVSAVAKDRKLSMARVKEIADGRIFSGQHAKQLGLVDEIGTLSDSIREAGKLSGITGRPRVQEEPQFRSWIERIFHGIWPSGWMPEQLHASRGLQYLWVY